MTQKSSLRFLCVDDEPDIESITRRLKTVGKFDLVLERPVPDWAAQVENIQKAMTAGHYAGLLIDFRLDEVHAAPKPKNNAAGKVRYTAEALISELRRRSLECGRDDNNSYPIILWSTAALLKEFYELNPAYNVSYDDIWDKGLLPDDIPGYARRLKILSAGYAEIAAILENVPKGQSAVSSLLAIDASSRVVRDFEQYMFKRPKGKPHTFQYALFVRHDILGVNGPLIDRPTLDAYLGINPVSENAWKALMSLLGPEIRYRGVMGDLFPRFWREAVLSKLESLTATSSWLSLPASERVSRLKKARKGLKVSAAEPIEKGYSTDFDCSCSVSFRPLSRRNGYRLLESRSLPWKQPDYVAGVEYRKKLTELSRSRPLEPEDKLRFNAQFGIRS